MYQVGIYGLLIQGQTSPQYRAKGKKKRYTGVFHASWRCIGNYCKAALQGVTPKKEIPFGVHGIPFSVEGPSKIPRENHKTVHQWILRQLTVNETKWALERSKQANTAFCLGIPFSVRVYIFLTKGAYPEKLPRERHIHAWNILSRDVKQQQTARNARI